MGKSSKLKKKKVTPQTKTNNAVLLLDNYGEESIMLHESLKRAGFDGPVIVVEDEGFLPEDVISLYGYFCKSSVDYVSTPLVPGKPRYFNQINIPDYWEIIANNGGGEIQDLYHKRGHIFYAEPKNKRLVKTVDWYDRNGVVRGCDHYDCKGMLYARTTLNKKGQRFCKSYYDAEGKEIIVENFVTRDIILNRDGQVFFYKNKIELILKLFEEEGIKADKILYNSLSTPFFVSETLTSDEKRDILFWQEPPRNDIPGNMQVILDNNASRTETIYVQNKASYTKLIELGAPKEKVKLLGFIYSYEKENAGGKDALICTNSDNIEQLEEIVKTMPKIHFHIAAITEMSPKLMGMGMYENVSLYPGVKMSVLDELFEKCDYYLDINHESEIVSAVKRAFMNNQLILAFRSTYHNTTFVAPEHIFENYKELTDLFEKAVENEAVLKQELKVQREAANAEQMEDYQKLF